MNKYVIASGGSGSMCVRALVFSLISHYLNPEVKMDGTIYIRIVDMDETSDAKKQCEAQIKEYEQLRMHANKGESGGLNLPKIVLEDWSFTSAVYRSAVKNGVQMDSKDPVTLRKLFEKQGAEKDGHTELLMKTFFTTAEQDEKLDKGFYGHPNIGSMVFNYVREDFLSTASMVDGATVQNEFMAHLMDDLREAGQGEKVPLYLYGSLFGGTGASVTPNLIDVLQSIRDNTAGAAAGNVNQNWGKTRLRIGAAMLMPYFNLPAPSQDEQKYALRPSADKFDAQTKEALKYYDEFKIVDKLDSLLLLGLARTARSVTSEVYARGGEQKQHFHVILLAAGVAGMRFLCDNSLGQGLLHWRLNFEDRPDQNAGHYSTLKLSEMGMAREEQDFENMFRFSLMVGQFLSGRFLQQVGNAPMDKTLNLMQEVIQTCRNQCAPSADDPAAPQPNPSRGFLGGWRANLTTSQLELGYREPIRQSGAFCKSFLNFYYDCAVSGHSWDGPEHSDNFSERFTDMLNLPKAARCVYNNSLGKELQDGTLCEYFNFACKNGERNVSVEFSDNLMGRLYADEMERLFAPKNDLNKSFSQVYVACYNAACAGLNQGGK